MNQDYEDAKGCGCFLLICVAVVFCLCSIKKEEMHHKQQANDGYKKEIRFSEIKYVIVNDLFVKRYGFKSANFYTLHHALVTSDIGNSFLTVFDDYNAPQINEKWTIEVVDSNCNNEYGHIAKLKERYK